MLVLTAAQPAACAARVVTEHYLRAAYGGHRGCVEAQAPGSAADELEFKALQIGRSTATAVVVPSGGPYDGERVEVSLIVDDGAWKVDALQAKVPVGP